MNDRTGAAIGMNTILSVSIVGLAGFIGIALACSVWLGAVNRSALSADNAGWSRLAPRLA